MVREILIPIAGAAAAYMVRELWRIYLRHQEDRDVESRRK